MSNPAAKLTLGQNVLYVDNKGHVKVALIIGTSESIVEGSHLATIPENHFNLLVTSPSGRQYPRAAVPAAEAVKDNDNYYTSDKNLVGVIYPVGTDIKLNPITVDPEAKKAPEQGGVGIIFVTLGDSADASATDDESPAEKSDDE